MEKKVKIGFALVSITTDQFAIIEDAYTDGEEVNFTTYANFSYDREQRLLAVTARFNFEQKGNPFLLLACSCHFLIEEETQLSFLNSKKEIITVPMNFMQHLGVITIGTARGILHAKTGSTNFNKFILPTINVTEIIKEDIVFNLKNKPANKLKK